MIYHIPTPGEERTAAKNTIGRRRCPVPLNALVAGAWLALIALATSGLAHGEPIHVHEGDDLFAVLAGLVAGDEVIVHAGTYRTQQSGGSWFRDVQLNGTSEAPIVVRAADGEPVVIEGDPAGSQNIINIGGMHYTWKGFEMAFGSHGVRVGTSAHATFEDLHIHDTNDVGLSCNRPGNTYEDVTLRGNHIHHTSGTGECFYLGCNDDACQMWDSLVEYNWCHDTLGASQGDGIELKTGSYNTVIWHNVIHDVNYPAITMYGAMGRGNNLVEGNIVWNTIDNGIQVVGEVELRNNVIFDAGINGIHAKASQGETPHDLTVLHNSVVSAGNACFKGNNWSDAFDTVVANNAFYCDGGAAISIVGGASTAVFAANVVVGSSSEGGTIPGRGQAEDLSDVTAHDAYPTDDSPLIDAGDSAWMLDADFNNHTRQEAPDVGAYTWSGTGNPAGAPGADFKPRTLWLDQDPLVRGARVAFRARGAWPGQALVVAAALADGPGPCPPALGGLCLDLVRPRVLGISIADELGDGTVTITMPSSAPPVTVYTQAAQGGAHPNASNVVVDDIQP